MPTSGAASSDGGGLLEVGRITKAHGLRGEVVVYLSSDRTERVAPGSKLESDRGPLTVVSSRKHQDRWIVQIQGCTTREAAEQARGTVLSAAAISDPEGMLVHELIGCMVQTTDGTNRGRIESVMDNPAADLLVLESGILVPVVFALGGPVDGVLLVDTPDGLFELLDS